MSSGFEIIAICYICVTFGFYTGALFAALMRGEDFRNEPLSSLARGFFGSFLWPLVVGAIIYYGTKGFLRGRN